MRERASEGDSQKGASAAASVLQQQQQQYGSRGTRGDACLSLSSRTQWREEQQQQRRERGGSGSKSKRGSCSERLRERVTESRDRLTWIEWLRSRGLTSDP